MRSIALCLLAAVSTATAAPAPSPPAAGARLFVSGHSLTDQPIPSDLAAIAASLDQPLQWNRQYMVGSSIRARVRGQNGGMTGWAGYRMGYNRRGQGLDVVAELQQPQTVSGGPYDLLLITEQHGILESLLWNDTVRHLRHYHERFIDGNPRGRTYFYESWLSLNDKSDPRRWIAYERTVSPVWQCIATRINTSLDAEGRPDRIRSIPAGLALAELVERATAGSVAGITQPSVRATVDSLIKDDVHLTRLGSYYVALVSYAAMFDGSPAGAWHPADVTPAQAASLQAVAGDFVARYKATNRPLTLAQCRALIHGSFAQTYWRYVHDTFWHDRPALSATVKRWRHTIAWRWRFWRENAENPFHYDAETDAAYWYPAP